ncbi:YPDG domain-containing protein [Bifidobacterium sp. LC6]|uniref:YPDG domain-containing protein n=1 Tax=Bifidobacterium colobi TaxID=2809026 RepID=A0ABS5UXM3_9BIFI|nr:Rib/alpha-like domain-containing protein [Bifidobacterium colobi]MBT1175048.1 YPDG domain-containing protein [Bifidobacterium colobi]
MSLPTSGHGPKTIAAIVALGTALAFATPTAAFAQQTTNTKDSSKGTTYYVSSEHGNDANAGTSQNSPWKTLTKVNEIASDLEPGDSVLLEYGSEFNDQWLHISNTAGTPNAPITISAYGDAAEGKPLIASNGVEGSQWYQDYRANVGNHKTRGTVSTTLLLKDVSYITVSNLEITNDDENVYDPIDSWQWTDTADSDGTSLDRSADRMDRTGVAGIAENGSTMSHVTLDNLNIHDVDGNLYNKHMANGGIYFMAHLPKERTSAADDAWLKEHVSRFDHITIRNSTVKDVDRWGIAVGYTAYLNYIDKSSRWQNDFDYGDGTIDDDLIAKYGATNVLIENNTIIGAGGDAITTMYCDRPIIQHNVGDRVSKHINTVDYTANVLNNSGNAGVGYGRVAAGIWPWRCKDPVFQYNEMYSNLNADHGNGDGQAWDADYGDGTLYQYNYSYGNSFASLMICNWFAINTTFRYNISQNDKRGVFDLPSNGTGNHIYNNTVYVDKDSQVLTNRSNSQAQFENNIFINATGEKKTETWNRGNQYGGQTYDNNLYVNYANTPASDAHAIVADDVADVLEDAGSAPTAAQASGAVYSRKGGATAFDGYKPTTNSPAINAGKVVSDLNDYDVEHDFFGNSIKGKPDLGAVESGVASASMTSSKYETATVDGTKVMYVTFTDKNPVTVKELLANVSADNGVSKAVYRKSTNAFKQLFSLVAGPDAALTKLEDTEAIQEGDILRFSVDGSSTTDDYTIVQRISWDWVADYEHGTADHDWKAQRQTSAGGAWQTITTYDSDWPQTSYNTYYGVGLDYDDFNTNGHKLPAADQRDSIHGLIAEDPAAAGGTAMAWKAPEAGTVKVSIKSDEPYLRQNGNNGKAMTLKLMHNDKELCSADLTVSKQQSTEFAQCVTQHGTITVNEGDWIRITADAETGMSKSSAHISPVISYEDVEPPAEAEAKQYTVSYDSVAATVGAQAKAVAAFTKDGKTVNAPAGVSFAIADGDGVALDAKTGVATFTPSADQYGTTVTRMVTVTYADGSSSTATITFTVAQSYAQRYDVRYTNVAMNAGATATTRSPRFFVKSDGAAAAKPTGTVFSLDGTVAGASIDEQTGDVTLAAGATAGTVTVPVTVTYPGTQGTASASVTFTVKQPASLSSSELETGTVNGTKVIYAPISSDSPMSVAQLLAKVSSEPADADKVVYRAGKALDGTENLAAGDVLRISVAGSTVADEYVVTAKTSWNWVDDFKINEQGPLWYGQRQTAQGSDWANITGFDGTYPNWMYETYYGPGVDFGSHNLPADRSAIHGLISDSPASVGGAAMAWKAPKSGTVKVTIKDDEPYLRQTGNNGKALTVKLMHNDEEICSADLTVSQQQSTDFAQCVSEHGTITVNEGDWIRITAEAASGMNKPSAHISPVIDYVAGTAPKPEVNKDELKSEYEKALQLDESKYTPDSWAKFKAARDAAKVTLDNADASQDDVKTALDKLKAAIGALDEAQKPDPEPVQKLNEQYEPSYPAAVEATVGKAATAAVSFTKDGVASEAPEGTTYGIAGDGFTVAKDGTVTFTPSEVDYGQSRAAKVTVTYKDGTTDAATVVFAVAAKVVTPDPEPTPDTKPTEPTTKPNGSQPLLSNTGSSVAAAAITVVLTALAGLGLAMAVRHRK